MENSLLARLPAELRMSIWEYTLIEPDGTVLFCTKCSGSNRHSHLWNLPRKLALTQACVQIRHESRSIFFSANRFLFKNDCVCDLDGCVKQTLDRLPLELSRAMRSIRVRLTTPLCFWQDDCPGHAEYIVHEGHWELKLMQLFHSIKNITEQRPEVSILFESWLCYDRNTKLELKMIEYDETWVTALNHVRDERHLKGIADAEEQAARQELLTCTLNGLGRTLCRAMYSIKS